jgi:Uma2 family endonuclease
MSAIPLKREVEYPSSDGKPMAETDTHRDEMVYLIEALRRWFRDAEDVYVSGNIFLYYVEGDPRSSVSPDVLVAKGIADAKEQHDIYRVWEEGSPPVWVMEVTSRKTRLEDLNKKKLLYQSLGVQEYFLFDPLGDYLEPPLQGYRLLSGRYEPILVEGDGSIVSEELGLMLTREPQGLRMVDPRTGKRLLRPIEETDAREAAERRAEQETAARRALEEELARLRAELERKGGG